MKINLGPNELTGLTLSTLVEVDSISFAEMIGLFL